MCNFSGMIKNVLPSLRQRAGPQRICSRQKSIRSGTARDSFSQTPHMRGKDVELFALFVHHGITPACAGKRWIMMKPGWRCRDHPRVCGEKSLLLGSSGSMGESPPHMRGKARHCAAVHGYRGITPAHAGKSFTSFYHCTTFWDHPRTCGEKLIPPLLGFGLTGSPPHMRGKERGSTSRQRRKGITPAHAGKRVVAEVCFVSNADHPRTCGEKTKKIP